MPTTPTCRLLLALGRNQSAWVSEMVLGETHPAEYPDLAELPSLQRKRLVERYGATHFWRLTAEGQRSFSQLVARLGGQQDTPRASAAAG
jgi:hypothetical protein